MWKKNQFALILYTKSHFRAIFGPTCIHLYKKLRNFRTVPPGVTNLVSKCAGNLKEKSHKVSRRELCALPSNRAKCLGGGPFRPPPPVFLGLKVAATSMKLEIRLHMIWYQCHFYDHLIGSWMPSKLGYSPCILSGLHDGAATLKWFQS